MGPFFQNNITTNDIQFINSLLQDTLTYTPTTKTSLWTRNTQRTLTKQTQQLYISVWISWGLGFCAIVNELFFYKYITEDPSKRPFTLTNQNQFYFKLPTNQNQFYFKLPTNQNQFYLKLPTNQNQLLLIQI